MLLRGLRCFQPRLFTYPTSKNVWSSFYAFHSVFFVLGIFYAN